MAERVEHVRAGRGGFGADEVDKFCAAGVELDDLCLQCGDAWGADGVVHGAVLKGGQVAVDRGAGGCDLGLDRGEFGAAVGVAVVVVLPGAGDDIGEQVGAAGEGVGDGGEDCGLEIVGVDATRGTAGGAVAGAGEAGVVPVAAGLAGGGGADVLVPAAWAGDQSGAVVVGVAAGALGLLVAAGVAQPLGGGERRLVDEGRVGVGGDDVAEVDLAQVDAVGEDAADVVSAPGFAGAVAHASAVELVGDGAGAEPGGDVQVEDLPQDGCLGRVRGEPVVVVVDKVAVGAGAAGPLALAGLGGHAVDDAVDDGAAFELGEHAEQLQEHAAHRGGGVEVFGGRAERHVGGVELLDQGHHVGQAAGEPVDAVDQQDVVASGVGGGQRRV
ncbi:MAG TPA: hypothetical protein VF755_17825 [Catenuloplanes sp.]